MSLSNLRKLLSRFAERSVYNPLTLIGNVNRDALRAVADEGKTTGGPTADGGSPAASSRNSSSADADPDRPDSIADDRAVDPADLNAISEAIPECDLSNSVD